MFGEPATHLFHGQSEDICVGETELRSGALALSIDEGKIFGVTGEIAVGRHEGVERMRPGHVGDLAAGAFIKAMEVAVQPVSGGPFPALGFGEKTSR